MARGSGSSSGRNRRSIASRAAPDAEATPFSEFDDAWLRTIQENPGIRFVDLTAWQDRRRYHPRGLGKFPRPENYHAVGWHHKPRIVVVPEDHALAKRATYNQRYSLRDVWTGKTYRESDFYADHVDRYQRRSYQWHRGQYRRLGFHAPWQVVICVRRQRRKEVMFAYGRAGKVGNGRGKRQRRNYYSQVRC